MNDPRRLLEDPSLLQNGGDLARSLLESGGDVAPPAGAKAQIWGNLQNLIGPPGGGPGGGSGSNAPGTQGPAPPAPGPAIGGPIAGSSPLNAANAAAGKATSTALATKLGLVGLLAGGALFLGTLVSRPEPTLEVTAPEPIHTEESVDAHFTLPTSTAFEAPVARRETNEPKDAATAARDAAGPAPIIEARSAPVVMSSALREGEGVQRARADLAAGRPASALAELAALDRDVPRGMLGQERQVLTIEALAGSGQADAAARLASAFIEAQPTSPYAERVRRFAR